MENNFSGFRKELNLKKIKESRKGNISLNESVEATLKAIEKALVFLKLEHNQL